MLVCSAGVDAGIVGRERRDEMDYCSQMGTGCEWLIGVAEVVVVVVVVVVGDVDVVFRHPLLERECQFVAFEVLGRQDLVRLT